MEQRIDFPYFLINLLSFYFFDQATDHFFKAYAISFNEHLSMNYYKYLVTKKSLKNIPYRKFSLNCKQKKKRTCLNKMPF